MEQYDDSQKVLKPFMDLSLGRNTINTYVEPQNSWSNIILNHPSFNTNEVSQENIGKSNDCLSNDSVGTKNAMVNLVVEEPIGPFSNRSVRNGFVRKVYTILSVQLLITCIGSGIMLTLFKDRFNFKTIEERSDKSVAIMAYMLFFGSLVVSMCIFCCFICVESTRKAFPTNFVLLFIWTICETIIVGIVCCQSHGINVLYAFGLTCVVVISITLLATTPWFDITNCGCLLIMILLIHMIMGIILYMVLGSVGASKEEAKPWLLALAIAGALIFSLYLLYDTQMILGGKKYEIGPEEYILAAIMLYIDIIQIFLYILRILNLTDNN